MSRCYLTAITVCLISPIYHYDYRYTREKFGGYFVGISEPSRESAARRSLSERVNERWPFISSWERIVILPRRFTHCMGLPTNWNPLRKA